MLLNRVRGARAASTIAEVFKAFPDASSMASADGRLEEILRPLGLQNVRADRLRRLGEAYLRGFRRVEDLPGIGRYAADSWKMFVEGRTDVEPEDTLLRAYLRRVR